ncbi:MAG: nucleotidyltransferase family protein [Hyphomicrobiales bacterium]|nr:nucleotidyltransferase family protein [Hyphomicrobiales bacterium]
MTQRPVRNAMVLGAGLGKRMRPLTEKRPKPLIEVKRHPLIDHVLDRLEEAGVEHAVVNVHHLADQLEDHLSGRAKPRISISNERDEILDTGGGVKAALPLLGEDPFFILAADTLWLEGPTSNLLKLARSFDPERMDMLLLVASTVNSIGYDGPGDFRMEVDGRLRRRDEHTIAPFAYASAMITHPGFYEDTPEGPFSNNLLFDRAASLGRLYGMRLDGTWLHVGTPRALDEAEEAFSELLF